MLTRKYKDCVDNNKKTGAGAMTFKFFDHMENILGDRKTIQGQSTISSTFVKKNLKSKSSTMPASRFMAHSDTSIEIDESSSTSNTASTISINSAQKRICENLSESRRLSKNKQAVEKVANTETTKITDVYPTSISNIQKSKRPQHGSGSRIATSKIELEKQ